MIVPAEVFGPWLTSKNVRLGPTPEDLLAMHRACLRENNPRNDDPDDPECVVVLGTA